MVQSMPLSTVNISVSLIYKATGVLTKKSHELCKLLLRFWLVKSIIWRADVVAGNFTVILKNQSNQTYYSKVETTFKCEIRAT